MKLKNVFVALGFALISQTLVAPNSSRAEGGCPNGFVPIGGGYCRNIVCPQSNILANADSDTEPVMAKYGLRCPVQGTGGMSFGIGKWGNQLIPKR